MFERAFIPSRSMLVPLTFLFGFAFSGAAAAEARVSEAYGKLPLHFEANRGQTHEDVRFLARGPGYSLYLTAGEAVLVLARPNPDAKRDAHSAPERLNTQKRARPVVVRMSLVGAAPKPPVSGLEELPGKANYFIGKDPAKWRTNVPIYAKVHYRDVYPGIDLLYYGNQRQLEHDFVVHPGADPSRIALSFQGADKLEVNAEGDLVMHTASGAIRQRKPVMYQEIDGIRREIDGAYVLKGANRVGFQVAAYDASRPLVIDPVLLYSTYLGGSFNDQGLSIAVDVSGNAYVTGRTESDDFPTTAGTFQTTLIGAADVFVTKLNPTGSALVYSTYLGGSGSFDGGEAGIAIAVDASDNAYVTGTTSSTDFPTTPGAFDTTFNGGFFDAFVTKLDATGSALAYSTYLGGNRDDLGHGIAVDTAGNAYVTGRTDSTNLPTTAGAFDTTHNGNADAFVTKLNPAGSALVYSTYLGGNGVDSLFRGDVAVDGSGNAYVTGSTNSTNFPTTPGAFDTTHDGFDDAFVTKLNPAGSALVYSTYLGGTSNDNGVRIRVDATGNAYVTGRTSSTNFPTTPGAFNTISNGGGFDAFVTKLDATGSALVYSTYLGGSANDEGFGIAVDVAGNAHVTGRTDSANFPTTAGTFDATLGGGSDAFLTKLNATGTGLVYSTYLGGGGFDEAISVALDALPNPNAYVTGRTGSTDFPTTTGAFDTTHNGFQDVFVAKITDIVLPPPPTIGKVTGGGSINVTNGIGTFGFIVQRKTMDSPAQGQLQYVNHATKAKVHSEMFTTFVITGNMATFGGTCTSNGAPCTFNVEVVDNGEPGKDDVFTITVNAGPAEGGTLRSGNIQIHD